MARIKIEDLPVLQQLDEQAVRGIFGGFEAWPSEWKFSEMDGKSNNTTTAVPFHRVINSSIYGRIDPPRG